MCMPHYISLPMLRVTVDEKLNKILDRIVTVLALIVAIIAILVAKGLL